MMQKKILPIIIFLFFTATVHANSETTLLFPHPFYLGLTGGYGSTTWGGLVPSKNKQNNALNISTPTYVKEGGAIWGAFVGYEFIPFFAIEGAYTRYPDAKVSFDPMSLFTFEHDGLTSLTTKTETVSLMGKIMLVIPNTKIRAYSSVGGAEVHRSDQLNDHWQLSPTFGLGFTYNITDHIMTELGANYTSGAGESELNPAQDYVPFLYSVFFHLGYRF